MKQNKRIVVEQSEGPARRGSVSPILLVLLGMGLLVVAFILDALRIHQAGAEMLAASDAAALAAAGTLVDDRTLLINDAGINLLCDEAKSEGARYAFMNGGVGPNGMTADISKSIEVLFGSRQQTDNFPLPDLVRVVVHRTSQQGNAVPLLLTPWIAAGGVDMQRQSVVLIDRYIVGFIPSMETAIPMVPLGIHSDRSQRYPDAWESQLARPHQDEHAYDARTGTFLDQQGDGIPEFRFRLTQNIWPLEFGTRSNLQSQIESGLQTDDVADLGGKIQLSAAGSMINLLRHPAGINEERSSQRVGLENGLKSLRDSAEPRVWPLVCPSTANPPQVRLVGFIAARVVGIESGLAKATPRDGNSDIDDSISSVTVVLQPSVLATATALTAFPEPLAESDSEEVFQNPFIAKVRLVQ